jgi:hypothetical protein
LISGWQRLELVLHQPKGQSVSTVQPSQALAAPPVGVHAAAALHVTVPGDTQAACPLHTMRPVTVVGLPATHIPFDPAQVVAPEALWQAPLPWPQLVAAHGPAVLHITLQQMLPSSWPLWHRAELADDWPPANFPQVWALVSHV